MMTFLIVATALAEASASSSMAGPPETDEGQSIVVEGRRRARNWEMPKLEYHERAGCPSVVETEFPGFGTVRIRRSCAADRTEEWRLFQY